MLTVWWSQTDWALENMCTAYIPTMDFRANFYNVTVVSVDIMLKSTQNNTQFIETHYNVTVVSVDIMLKITQNNTQFIETHT